MFSIFLLTRNAIILYQNSLKICAKLSYKLTVSKSALMSSEFDEFVVCVTTRLNDAEQCQTSVDARIVSNASRSLEAAVDAIRLFIPEPTARSAVRGY